MKRRVPPVMLAVGLVGALTGSAVAQKDSITVALKNEKAQSIGTATLSSEGEGGVSIALDLENLTPGEHAIHVHEVATCDPPAFDSAGPHFNPAGRQHGLRNPQGPHAGDMSNFTVAANGKAHTTVVNPRITLMTTGSNSVFAGGGTALVIHAKPDDLLSDPAGNAGDRIACGLITR